MQEPQPAGARRQGMGAYSALMALALLTLAICVACFGLRAGPVLAQVQKPTVNVFPIPGSRVASPQSQIAFRGVAAGSLGAIQVLGSRSGAHSGQVEPDSDGRGASFVPAQPFVPGETVTVTTSLGVVGGQAGTFHFQVANPAPPIPFSRARLVQRVSGDVWSFHSQSGLAPPALRITHGVGAGGSSDLFLTPQFGPVQNGPEIVDPRGQLIWFSPVPTGYTAANLQVQRYRGRPVLTWWQGYSSAGVGVGQDMIMDSAYQPVATVQAANGLHADLHEFQLTPSGTALITAIYPVYWDASSVHSIKHEIVFDSVIQEIDIPTGLVRYQWDSLDHIPLADSYQPPPPEGPKVGYRNPYDYFHANSIQLEGDGSLLISARNTWAVYKLDHDTGAVIWRLGGKHSSFRMLSGAGFAFQHDVRSHSRGDRYVTVFDDGAGLPVVHPQSRALELTLNAKHRTARVFKQWGHSPRLLSLFEGNDQQLPDLDQFVGWGQEPYFTEFDQRRHVVLDGRFVSNTSSYRAYRFAWSATPAQPPAVAIAPTGNRMTVYVSWNGATNVGSWRVLTGTSATALHPVATAHRTSFETSVRVPRAPYVSAQALDSSGRVLAASATAGVP